MKPHYLILLICLLTPYIMKGADTLDIQRWEFEISAGIAGPLGTKKGWQNRVGGDFGLELRYNIKPVPISVTGSIRWVWPTRRIPTLDGHYGSRGNNQYQIEAGAEYNFKRGCKWSYFAGASVGEAFLPHSNTYLRPKAGVEYSNCLRLTVYPTFCFRKEPGHFNTWSVTIGYVFGGRPKRHLTAGNKNEN